MSILKCNYNNGNYALKFNWNDGTNRISTDYISDRQPIQLPKITAKTVNNAKVKLFENWYKDANYIELVEFGLNNKYINIENNNVQCYAKWEEIGEINKKNISWDIREEGVELSAKQTVYTWTRVLNNDILSISYENSLGLATSSSNNIIILLNNNIIINIDTKKYTAGDIKIIDLPVNKNDILCIKITKNTSILNKLNINVIGRNQDNNYLYAKTEVENTQQNINNLPTLAKQYYTFNNWHIYDADNIASAEYSIEGECFKNKGRDIGQNAMNGEDVYTTNDLKQKVKRIWYAPILHFNEYNDYYKGQSYLDAIWPNDYAIFKKDDYVRDMKYEKVQSYKEAIPLNYQVKGENLYLIKKGALPTPFECSPGISNESYEDHWRGHVNAEGILNYYSVLPEFTPCNAIWYSEENPVTNLHFGLYKLLYKESNNSLTVLANKLDITNFTFNWEELGTYHTNSNKITCILSGGGRSGYVGDPTITGDGAVEGGSSGAVSIFRIDLSKLKNDDSNNRVLYVYVALSTGKNEDGIDSYIYFETTSNSKAWQFVVQGGKEDRDFSSNEVFKYAGIKYLTSDSSSIISPAGIEMKNAKNISEDEFLKNQSVVSIWTVTGGVSNTLSGFTTYTIPDSNFNYNIYDSEKYSYQSLDGINLRIYTGLKGTDSNQWNYKVYGGSPGLGGGGNSAYKKNLIPQDATAGKIGGGGGAMTSGTVPTSGGYGGAGVFVIYN